MIISKKELREEIEKLLIHRNELAISVIKFGQKLSSYGDKYQLNGQDSAYGQEALKNILAMINELETLKPEIKSKIKK